MNQILISETLYVTPEIRRKKRLYKYSFIIAVILVVALSFYYFMSEHLQNKDAEKAEHLLSSINFVIDEIDTGEVTLSRGSSVVVLNETQADQDRIDRASQEKIRDEKIKMQEALKIAQRRTGEKTESGIKYYTAAILNIPRLKIRYAVIDTISSTPIAEESKAESIFEELLRISPVKFWGPNPNQTGNYCIVGHNYTSAWNQSLRHKFFSHLDKIKVGDIIELTGLSGDLIRYKVYDYMVVAPTNTDATSQKTDGKREVTLITCTDDVRGRIIVRAREV